MTCVSITHCVYGILDFDLATCVYAAGFRTTADIAAGFRTAADAAALIICFDAGNWLIHLIRRRCLCRLHRLAVFDATLRIQLRPPMYTKLCIILASTAECIRHIVEAFQGRALRRHAAVISCLADACPCAALLFRLIRRKGLLVAFRCLAQRRSACCRFGIVETELRTHCIQLLLAGSCLHGIHGLDTSAFLECARSLLARHFLAAQLGRLHKITVIL